MTYTFPGIAPQGISRGWSVQYPRGFPEAGQYSTHTSAQGLSVKELFSLNNLSRSYSILKSGFFYLSLHSTHSPRQGASEKMEVFLTKRLAALRRRLVEYHLSLWFKWLHTVESHKLVTSSFLFTGGQREVFSGFISSS